MAYEFNLTVNGYDVNAGYSERTINEDIIPLLRRMTALYKDKGSRVIVFLAAPPAAGKSTVVLACEQLSQQMEEFEPIKTCGIDGFHYTNEYLASHTCERDHETVVLKSIKGAPETYDTAHLEEKLKALLASDEEVRFPVYDRSIHNPREDALTVNAGIVLIEGNYLLLNEAPWNSLQKYADLTVFLHTDESLLKERLIQRKMKGGPTREEAERWYEQTDGPNVRKVLRDSVPADWNIYND